MPPIPASFGSSALLSYGLVGRSRIVLPSPAYTSRDLYVFTSSASFNFGAARTFEYLVVGGGGGGGTGYGGGGGGGGVKVGSTTTPTGPLSIYVGGGGAPNANGGNSGFVHPGATVWAEGGGRGGATDLALPSANGGSGGGGYGGQSPLIGFGGFATTSPFGNAGGAGGYYAGGGGGANSAGGFGVSANNVKMVKASIYSTYSGGTRGGNYSVQWSNNGISWTTSFSGVMSSNACGIFDGSITSSPSLGRYPFWRYVVGSNTATHHPRSSRIYLTDEYNNTYQVVSYTDDNCSDSGVIPAPGENFTVYETGLSTPVTRSGNGGSAFTSTITGFATPFGAGGGGWNSYGGDWSAGGAAPSPSTSAMQRRGGGGAGGSGTPGGSGGSGVVIISTPRALGPAADNTQFSFANTTTWQAPTGLNTIELLLVAGGGGGGSGFGGGGGAGGVRFTPSFPVSPGSTYNITIGAGGAYGDFFSVGGSGSDTSFSGPGIATRTASGGGGGSANYYYPPYVPVPATSGGSGGGATNIGYSESFQPFGFYQGSLQSAGASGNSGGYTPTEGYGGGGSNGKDDAQAGGGGGGAGGAGGDVPGYNPANNITTSAGNYRGGVGGTGVTFLYHSVGGGGGGGNRASAPAPSTTWGGGLGASSTAPHSRDFFSPFAAVAPATGSFATGGRFASGGGGGGGGSPTMSNPNFYGGFEEAGSGGSGLVVIRYAGSYPYIPYFSTDIDSATTLQTNPPRYILS